MGQVLSSQSEINDQPVTVVGKTRLAANRVLETPELLEMVLVQTDMRTLLISAQRVCHTWKAVMDHSPSIQRALFFKGSQDSPKVNWDWSEVRILQTTDVKNAVLNPLLVENFPSLFPGKESMGSDSDFLGLPDLQILMRMDASWRRMLVSQPPIADIGVFHFLSTMGGTSAACCYIRTEPESGRKPTDNSNRQSTPNSKHLTMEHLLDTLLFNSKIRFRKWMSTRIRWSTEAEGAISKATVRQFGRKGSNFQREFQRFGVVVHMSETVTCVTRSVGKVSKAQYRIQSIVRAYEKAEGEVEAIRREKRINECTATMGTLRRRR
ncbi:hypothetical protein BDV19DRAFT_352127 [Aspergillus venezuelensis]